MLPKKIAGRFMNIRITKEFKFEMAHALWGYHGPCKNIHGHSYTLTVTVKGKPIGDIQSPELGMVMDFGDLKKIVGSEIIEKFDHSLILNNKDQLVSVLNHQKLVSVAFQPTCENMLIHFSELLLSRLPQNVTLHHLLLRETSTSYAEWYAEDNQ